MTDLKRKLSSRKLWTMVIGVITGICVIFKLDEDTISLITGAVIIVSSIITYILAEAKVDASNKK